MYLHVRNSGSRAFVTIKYADKYNIMYVYSLNGIISKYAPFRLIAAIRTEYFWDCIKLSYQNEREVVLSFCEYIDPMKAKISCALAFVRGNDFNRASYGDPTIWSKRETSLCTRVIG